MADVTAAQEAPKPSDTAPAATAAPQPASPAAAPPSASDPKSPDLPEVQVIQKKETPKPIEQAAKKPKKKPAPIIEAYEPVPTEAGSSDSAGLGDTDANTGAGGAAGTTGIKGYSAPNASVGTKTDTPILETPMTDKDIENIAAFWNSLGAVVNAQQ